MPELFTQRQMRRFVAIWSCAIALVGLIATTAHRDPKPVHVAASGPRTLPALPTVTVPTTVPLPDVTVPPVTVPDVPVPDVTLPPVTVPSLAPPFQPTSQGLWLVDADQQSGRLISSETTLDVSFSPNGRELAMTTETGKDEYGMPTRALQVLDVDSGATRRLAPDAIVPQAVQWSPDGQWIAFSTFPQRGDGAGVGGYLWVVHQDGSGLRRVAPIDGGWRLAWSPDSTRVTQPQPNLHDVAVIDIATGAVTSLSYDKAYLADWLPDGRIVASGMNGDNDTTVLIDPATNTVSTINDSAFFSRPSPSGQTIAVRVGHIGGMAGIMPTVGGVVRPLVPGSPIDWSADGTSLTVSDTDMDVTVCDATTGLSRLAVVGDRDKKWTVSPTVWSPVARRFLVMVWGYEATYAP